MDPDKVRRRAVGGAIGASSLDDFLAKLSTPRAAWALLSAGEITASAATDLASRTGAGDLIRDAGNSHYRDHRAWAKTLDEPRIHHVDVGTSGRVWGLDRGCCVMIGEDEVVDRYRPIFEAVTPGVGAAERTSSRDGAPSSSEHGYLRCGPYGDGRFVKLVHNRIECGAMGLFANKVLYAMREQFDRPPEKPAG